MDLSMPTSGDMPFCGAMMERCDGPSWLCDEDDDDESTTVVNVPEIHSGFTGSSPS